jgi:hypothetical protein
VHLTLVRNGDVTALVTSPFLFVRVILLRCVASSHDRCIAWTMSAGLLGAAPLIRVPTRIRSVPHQPRNRPGSLRCVARQIAAHSRASRWRSSAASTCTANGRQYPIVRPT